jgi:hypothetical protein
MIMAMNECPGAVSVFPAFTGDIDSPSHKMHAVSEGHYKRVEWGGPDGLWRTDWLKSHIDYKLKYGWGMDFELGYLARQDGFTQWVNNSVTVELLEHNGYPKRRKISLEDANRKASENMNVILSGKYGDWMSLFGIKL